MALIGMFWVFEPIRASDRESAAVVLVDRIERRLPDGINEREQMPLVRPLSIDRPTTARELPEVEIDRATKGQTHFASSSSHVIVRLFDHGPRNISIALVVLSSM